MKKLTRRDSLALLAFSPLAAWASGGNQPAPAASQRRWAEIAPREMIRQRYFPDVVLQTQENKQVQLYRDLIKDKVMLINFMYASCNGICPRVTQNLVKVQKLLGGRMGKDIFFYSFTLDPSHDTPKVLKEYAAMHRVGPDGTVWALYVDATALDSNNNPTGNKLMPAFYIIAAGVLSIVVVGATLGGVQRRAAAARS